MINNLMWSITAVVIIGIISTSILFTVVRNRILMDKGLIFIISFAIGVLYGSAFYHLLPHVYLHYAPSSIQAGTLICLGIISMFVVEKGLMVHRCYHWHQCDHTGVHAYTNIIGDTMHNFLDGMIIGGSFMISIPLGIITALAAGMHEIPKELSDVTILINSGLQPKRALILNILTCSVSLLGIAAIFSFGSLAEIERILLPLATGIFIYHAGSDLMPLLHKDVFLARIIPEFLLMIGGFILMLLIRLLNHNHI